MNIKEYIYGFLAVAMFVMLLFLYLLVTAPYGAYESDFHYEASFPANQI